MKILLLGDASNCHRTLATGLRRLGQDVTVASDGSKWMQTERDIDTTRRKGGKIGGLELYLRIKYRLRKQLSGYDVVAIHNPIFLELRPERCREIFDQLKRQNKALFLTALSADTPYVEECLDPTSAMRYNEYRIYNQASPFAQENLRETQAWLNEPLRSHCDYIYDNIDGAVSALYEYHLGLQRRLPEEKICYGGIPIEVDRYEFTPPSETPGVVRLFLGRHSHRQQIKGTDLLEVAARRAIDRHPGKAELAIVENQPYDKYVELMRSAHVVLDQAYSHTPATNALIAMAYGMNVVSGGEPAYYDFIGEANNRPIINCPPDVEAMTDVIEEVITHPEKLRERSIAGRRFVEQHNDATTVARRYLEFWSRCAGVNQYSE